MRQKSKTPKTETPKSGTGNPDSHLNPLRKKAEQKLGKQTRRIDELSSQDIKKLIHQVGTYQIELEMQNEELRQKQAELQDITNQYADLYDFAPTGYFTFDENGTVLKLNIRGANLLGIERRQLINKAFTDFVHRDDQDIFFLHRRSVFESGSPQTCEIRLIRQDKSFFYALFESISVEDIQNQTFRCRTVVSDISLQKRAEAALRESEVKYRSIFEGANDGIVACDLATGKFLFVNKRMCDLTGYPEEEMLRHGVKDLHPEKDLPYVLDIFNKMVSGELTEARAIPVLRKDGCVIYCDISSSFMDKEDHSILLGFFRDVTEREEAESALRESEMRFRIMADGSPLMIWGTNASTRIEFVNREYCEFFGTTVEAVRSEGWQPLVHPEDAPEYITEFAACIRNYRPFHALARVKRHDGEWRWIESWGHPRFSDTGEFLGMVGSSPDITERRRAQERARKEHEQTTFANRVLRVFVEHEGDELFDRALAIVQEYMASPHGVFGYISEPGHLICPSLSKMLDECEVEGKCIHYPPEKWKGLWARALKEKRSFFTNRAQPVPPGHPAIRSNLAAPVLFHGEAIGLLNLANKEGGYTEEDRQTVDALASRISPVLYAWIQRKLREDESRQAEEALHETLWDLERSNRELEQFAYIVSHDLKEPLRMITSYVQLLNKQYRDKLDKNSDEFMEYIVEGTMRMDALLNDLLAYSRIGKNAEPFSPVDLNDVAKQAIANLRRVINKSSAEIRFKNLPTVTADEIQMIQVFQNLIGNAIKFCGNEAPRINVSAELAGHEWKICVCDNGIGIEQKHLERIFLMFRRLHARGKYPGTGVGLAICKKIVERHEGRIWAESEHGKGSTFCFTIKNQTTP